MTHRRRHSGVRQTAVLAWMRLARIFQKVDTASAQMFRTHQLSTAQFDALAQIGAAGGITQQELANALLVTKGNISQLIVRLEQQGIVTRRQAGRTNCLFLTERGQALFDAVVPQQEALIAELFSPLSPEEQRQLLVLLRKLDQGLVR
ncbi:MAG: MarR family winged helix-turn-helix transcriptional regulator [Chloroflexaceae bacterium]